MSAGRSPETRVCVDDGREIDWATFATDVGRLAAVLSAHPPGRWVLFTENTYAFAVGLMGVWQAGAVAVLAPNGQPGTLADLAPGTLGLITERERHTVDIPRVDAIQPPGGGLESWRAVPLDRMAPRLELLTSGSTGIRKVVPKAIAHLEDEVIGLEGQWGSLLQGRDAFGTVSHQHIYGLLFRVLWPLSAGRVFRAQVLLQPEEIAAAMAHGGACFLVSSPAHLSRLKEFSGITGIVASCSPIFSSGGALDRRTAIRLREVFGRAPLEVFGSTETGGVAWRQQDGSAESLAWTPFRGVAAEVDPGEGVLRVRSPFVSDDSGTFTLADAVELLADGRFIAGPRNDRVVKLGDKRLSLPEMETMLAEHPFVAQAALVVLDRGVGTRLGVVVALSQPGCDALRAQGRRTVSHTLVQALAPYWDRILLPRVWRYVHRLPEDAQGKITAGELRAVLERPYDPAVVAPEVVAESASEHVRHQTLRVPETLGCLDGHFPEFPVVPGVVQLQWVMDVAGALAGRDVLLERIEALKFMDVLRPGDVFELRVEMSPEGHRFGFKLWNERSVFSSGRCVLATVARDTP